MRKMAPLIVLSAILSGCALFEALFEPRAFVELSINPGARTEQVFACVEKTVEKLARSSSKWLNPKVSKKDLEFGVIETGDFLESNVAGFRVRVTHFPQKNALTFLLRGAGPYYIDFGVEQELEKIKFGVHSCLEAT